MTLKNCSTLLYLFCVFLLASTSVGNAAPSPSPASQSAAASKVSPAPVAGQTKGAAAGPASALETFDNPVADRLVGKWTGDLDGMIQRKVIRVLTVYSKTTFFVDKGAQMGMVADAFRLFEDNLNKRLNNKNVRVKVVFVPVAADDLIPALLEGRGDIVAAGKLITAWRKEKVDFTKPTRSGISSIIVSGPGVAPISSVEDLSGKEVYLRPSDVSAENVKQFNARLAAAGKPPVKIRPAPEVLSDEDLLEMVNAGLASMTMVDDYVAQFWRQVFPKLVLSKDAAVRTDGQTAMMVRKNSPMLMAELNGFIAKYPEGSLERNVLTQKYLKSVKFAKAATAKEDVARLDQIVKFLRKYGDQYKLDYLLMAAQGYQESGLDQNKKSAVGAVGVMQLMPATGAEMKVGDITQMEANIHAGVKYMRFMIDRYFEKEPMARLDKVLFGFAAYNCGPGRLARLRKDAGRRGLDPNVWFHNVEYVAEEQIGHETVTYVSNIYKYYVAYQLIEKNLKEREEAKGSVKNASPD
jgi:membrane-bound lytic murein transglycosylase MltF